jgi:hypothetical protein
VIDLTTPKCVDLIVNTINTAEAHFQCKVGLIIIDTISKGIAASGGDEDKAKRREYRASEFAPDRRTHGCSRRRGRSHGQG